MLLYFFSHKTQKHVVLNKIYCLNKFFQKLIIPTYLEKTKHRTLKGRYGRGIVRKCYRKGGYKFSAEQFCCTNVMTSREVQEEYYYRSMTSYGMSATIEIMIVSLCVWTQIVTVSDPFRDVITFYENKVNMLGRSTHYLHYCYNHEWKFVFVYPIFMIE